MMLSCPCLLRCRTTYGPVIGILISPISLQSMNYYQEYMLLALYSMGKLCLRHNHLVNICQEHRCEMVKSIKSEQGSARRLSCSLFTLFTRRHLLIRRSTFQVESERAPVREARGSPAEVGRAQAAHRAR